MNYLLRIEAVNLSHFIYDTNDLSTVRGGGLLLLRAPERLRQSLAEKGWKVSEVSLGASVAVLQVDVPQPTDHSRLESDVAMFLNTRDDGLQHATILTAATPQSGDSADAFQRNWQTLVAKIRWQQMQIPSLRLPEPAGETSGEPGRGCCELDGLRPATETFSRGGVTKNVSTLTFLRHESGRRQRQELYDGEFQREPTARPAGWPNSVKFTDDFNELTARAGDDYLNQKMAVLYADGNDFGKIFKEHFPSPGDQATASGQLRKVRAGMLGQFLAMALADADWKTWQGKIRLETLLWGGDELIWVVPAWKGWETLRLFYEVSAQWELNSGKVDGQKLPLTHSAGLVFCHHNAPIKRIVDLAKYGLADAAKAQRRVLVKAGNQGREFEDLFCVEILESFDHLGTRLDHARRERLLKVTGLYSQAEEFSARFAFSGARLPAMLRAISRIKDAEFPRTQLATMVDLVVAKGSRPDTPGARELLRFLAAKHGNAIEPLRGLRKLLLPPGVTDAAASDSAARTDFEREFASDAHIWSLWYHLHEWWDYMPA